MPSRKKIPTAEYLRVVRGIAARTVRYNQQSDQINNKLGLCIEGYGGL